MSGEGGGSSSRTKAADRVPCVGEECRGEVLIPSVDGYMFCRCNRCSEDEVHDQACMPVSFVAQNLI